MLGNQDDVTAISDFQGKEGSVFISKLLPGKFLDEEGPDMKSRHIVEARVSEGRGYEPETTLSDSSALHAGRIPDGSREISGRLKQVMTLALLAWRPECAARL